LAGFNEVNLRQKVHCGCGLIGSSDGAFGPVFLIDCLLQGFVGCRDRSSAVAAMIRELD